MMFPGQGSQSVGMLATLADAESVIGDTFAEASEVLGYDLWRLCQQGPEEQLSGTERTQPAMLAAGVAVWRAWQRRGGAAPAMMAGHSLGEYSALVCAGSIEFRAAIELVRLRGQAMQRAVPAGIGAMAAILGLDDASIEAACIESAQGEVVQPVNYNSPGQLVIAGNTAAVARAIENCKARGAKRTALLPVSVPSHSALMRPAAEEMRERLRSLAVQAPAIRVYAFDGGLHDSPAAIRDGLYRQLFNPVRWSAIVAAMIAAGAQQLIECGPGKVLAGLARRAPGGRELTINAIDGADTFQAALAAATGSDDG
ncbi:MAG: malonyl CoA-ACP transacylase [Steroidobacteraceae bacterium]|nr:malonyl CoA-ACP transacylase [Steroidobacteraceae bacterium]